MNFKFLDFICAEPKGMATNSYYGYGMLLAILLLLIGSMQHDYLPNIILGLVLLLGHVAGSFKLNKPIRLLLRMTSLTLLFYLIASIIVLK
ncbi:hypothetical protein RGQ13_10605 [Thalassotalea psychrophila]|uniref:Uncharacterized protein n=1 Tax=Thalassotalea psychrophila TaxID=3065647 RepID=A0ABY9TPE9_9GAMM|nr:hypothetical protein RGQ13_10605 [Colwelliaceae bacterium SQ149]